MDNSYFAIAEGDFQAAEHLFAHTELYNIVAEKCQQSAEKFLKQIVFSAFNRHDDGIKYLLHIHDIPYIFEFLLGTYPELESIGDAAYYITKYYGTVKYPGHAFKDIDKDTARICLDAATEIKSKVYSMMRLYSLSY